MRRKELVVQASSAMRRKELVVQASSAI